MLGRAGSGRRRKATSWINGGYFVLRREIFDYLEGGKELVPDALNVLQEEDRLVAWRHEGFWASMDTPKEMYFLNELYSNGRRQVGEVG